MIYDSGFADFVDGILESWKVAPTQAEPDWAGVPSACLRTNLRAKVYQANPLARLAGEDAEVVDDVLLCLIEVEGNIQFSWILPTGFALLGGFGSLDQAIVELRKLSRRVVFSGEVFGRSFGE